MFDKQTTYAADYGKGKFAVSTPDGISLPLATDEFIGLDWIPEGSTLIIEDAHVKYIRTKKVRSSLAQPLDEKSQARFIGNARLKKVDVRVFSCKYTRRVFAAIDPQYAAVEANSKDDETDARIIREYFTTVDRQLMPRPLSLYSPDVAVREFKVSNDEILNSARTSWKLDGDCVSLTPSYLGGSGDGVDRVASELLEMDLVRKIKGDGFYHIKHFNQPLEVGDWLLDRSGSTVSGDRRELVVEIINRSPVKFLYTLMACVIDPDGGARTSDMNHRQIQSAVITPSDKRLGGIARSNVYWHYIRATHIAGVMRSRACDCGAKPVNYFKDGELQSELKGSTEARLPCEECQRIRSEYLAAARIAVRAILRLFIEWVESDESGRDSIYREMNSARYGVAMMF